MQFDEIYIRERETNSNGHRNFSKKIFHRSFSNWESRLTLSRRTTVGDRSLHPDTLFWEDNV